MSQILQRISISAGEKCQLKVVSAQCLWVKHDGKTSISKFFLPLESPILSREICLSKLLFAKSPAFWVTSPCLLSRSILQVWLLKSSYRWMKSADFCWSNPNLWKLMDKLSKNCSIQIFWAKISSTFGKLRSVFFFVFVGGFRHLRRQEGLWRPGTERSQWCWRRSAGGILSKENGTVIDHIWSLCYWDLTWFYCSIIFGDFLSINGWLRLHFWWFFCRLSHVKAIDQTGEISLSMGKWYGLHMGIISGTGALAACWKWCTSMIYLWTFDVTFHSLPVYHVG